MSRLFGFIFFLFLLFELPAQIVQVEPAFFTIDSEITITFDANQGNGGLVGVNQVYAHTGVITASGGAGNWQNVQGNWGTDDAKVKMTNIGDDKHQLSYKIRDFYNLTDSQNDVIQLSFVFRNVDGSKEGKTRANADIFVDLPEDNGFSVFFRSPQENNIVLSENESLTFEVVSSEEAEITLFDNDEVLANAQGQALEYVYTPTIQGEHVIKAVATSMVTGATIEESLTLIYAPDILIAADPNDRPLGLSRNGTSVSFKLHAPLKSSVFLLGSFNDFKVSQDYAMSFDEEEQSWWIELDDLNDEAYYTYQYLVDGALTIADPFSELILDPNNDGSVPNISNLPAYPIGQAQGIISLFERTKQDFNWTDQTFATAKTQDLVIYEILLRDFLESHSFTDLKDTLSYLKTLGVNAIESMPIQEFEANDSWGYNPSFHMALDKYYGTPKELKELVDAAHNEDIAVILDVVYNHAFGQSPLVQLYWDGSVNGPASNSPYLNTTARHPFNVGFDFNHESNATKDFVKRVVSYWLEEFHIDGFRFDLSKGFTQKQSSGDDNFRVYDPSRVAILEEYGNHIWNINPDAVLILEHFADNTEEKILAEKGFLLWGNSNFNFNEATMGYHENGKSDFSWASYQSRGWSEPNIVNYMESHDEERLVFKNLRFGNSSGDYTVRSEVAGYQRIEMATVFLFSIPGPKMIWQFGELGYDFSIDRCVDGSNNGCRLDPKPIRWDYQIDPIRQNIFETYQTMIDLKKNNDIFETNDFQLNVSAAFKTIHLNSDDGNAVAVANFDVNPLNREVSFPNNGMWYDVFTGDSIMVINGTYEFNLAPGNYGLYFDQSQGQTTPVVTLPGIDLNINLYPNPASSIIHAQITSPSAVMLEMSVVNQIGQVVKRFGQQEIQSGINDIQLDIQSLLSGIYILQMSDGRGVKGLEFVVE